MSFVKSVDRCSSDIECIEPPTAEGDLVTGIVKSVCNLEP